MLLRYDYQGAKAFAWTNESELFHPELKYIW